MVRAWWAGFTAQLTSEGDPVARILGTPELRARIEETVASIRDTERWACIHQLEQLAISIPNDSDESLGIRRAITVLAAPDETPGAELAPVMAPA